VDAPRGSPRHRKEKFIKCGKYTTYCGEYATKSEKNSTRGEIMIATGHLEGRTKGELPERSAGKKREADR
jgi:Fe-S oxidoreductase